MPNHTTLGAILGKLSRSVSLAFGLLALVGVPLAFSTSVYQIFVTPKLLVLVLCASFALPSVAVYGVFAESRCAAKSFLSSQPWNAPIFIAYLVWMIAAIAWNPIPATAFFGGSYNQMGVLTHLCFAVIALALAVGIGRSGVRLSITLWVIQVTGLLVSIYALMQFFKLDPFIFPLLYTYQQVQSDIVRVTGTLGHADYLGNYLLYLTPVAAGLVLKNRGWTKFFFLACLCCGTAALIASGTRGAWLGCFGAFVVILGLEGKSVFTEIDPGKRAGVLAVVGVCVLTIGVALGIGPNADSIVLRAKATVQEGFSGAGRVRLWRDAAAMVPKFALTGCGPEGFRREFLRFKSEELARIEPLSNNESSHNLYLDTVINFGVLGLGLYLAIVGSTLLLLIRARRVLSDPGERRLATGLLAAGIGVAIHNFFIYNQLATGLYAFAYWSLVRVFIFQTTWKENDGPASHPPIRFFIGLPVLGGALLFTVWAFGFARNTLVAEAEIRAAQSFVAKGDLVNTLNRCAAATEIPDPTDRYLRIAFILLASNPNLIPQADAATVDLMLTAGDTMAKRSLTPEFDYGLLAYLANGAGKKVLQEQFAREAVSWDAFSYRSRWLLADALFSQSKFQEAMREAEHAYRLNPTAPEAAQLRRKIRKSIEPVADHVDRLEKKAAKLTETEKNRKAIRVYRRLIKLAPDRTSEWRVGLARLYEKEEMWAEAIEAWETVATADPKRAEVENAAGRLARLREKMNIRRSGEQR